MKKGIKINEQIKENARKEDGYESMKNFKFKYKIKELIKV